MSTGRAGGDPDRGGPRPRPRRLRRPDGPVAAGWRRLTATRFMPTRRARTIRDFRAMLDRGDDGSKIGEESLMHSGVLFDAGSKVRAGMIARPTFVRVGRVEPTSHAAGRSPRQAFCPPKTRCEIDSPSLQESKSMADIVATAIGAGQFSTLVAAVKAAGLVETLQGPGPFTVFAPTDEAFAKLPAGTVESLLLPESKSKLVAVLTYHVVPGKVMAADVVGLTEAATVQGQKVKIDAKDGVKVDDANVIKTDIVCDNGVIHVIDAVILPE
ncbi:hypothetical protein HK102_009371 [Quaeritorhiza haematococci]|nr:hypothetical protein HK102_009371 [Quaeritorhiza haematococci]